MNTRSPSGESARLIAFHLRELAADLRGLADRLALLPPEVEDVDWNLRALLADASSLLEHDSEHHMGECVRLLAAPGVPVVLETRIDPPTSLPGSARELQEGLHRLIAGVQQCEARVGQCLASLAGTRQCAGLPERLVEDELRSVATRLCDELHPLAARLHAASVILYERSHPDAAEQERRDRERTLARNERTHPDARALTACPHCGASLSAEDRTADGSFCEACGTRWIA